MSLSKAGSLQEMPKEWTEKDKRNLIRFLLLDDKDKLAVMESAWATNDRIERYMKKYGTQTITRNENKHQKKDY